TRFARDWSSDVCSSDLLAAAPTLTAGTKLLQSFEGDGFGDWQVDGPAFGLAPVVERTEEMNASFRGYANESFACSAHGGDTPTRSEERRGGQRCGTRPL